MKTDPSSKKIEIIMRKSTTVSLYILHQYIYLHICPGWYVCKYLAYKIYDVNLMLITSVIK